MATRLGRLSALLAPLALTLAAARQAEAAPLLRVEKGAGAEDCPNATELEALVARLPGRNASSGSASYLVSFSRDGQQIRATIDTASGRRTVNFEGPHCAPLARATALTLAMLFDLEGEKELEGESPPEPTPPPPPVRDQPEGKTPVPAPAPTPASSRLELAAGAAGLAGVIGPIAPALLAEARLSFGALHVALGGFWVMPRSLELDPGLVEQAILAGTLRLCWDFASLGSATFGACSGAFLGVESAAAQGFTENESGSHLWLSIPLDLTLRTRANPLGLELAATALVNLVGRDFEVQGAGVAYRAWPVSPMLSLRVRFAVLPWLGAT